MTSPPPCLGALIYRFDKIQPQIWSLSLSWSITNFHDWKNCWETPIQMVVLKVVVLFGLCSVNDWSVLHEDVLHLRIGWGSCECCILSARTKTCGWLRLHPPPHTTVSSIHFIWEQIEKRSQNRTLSTMSYIPHNVSSGVCCSYQIMESFVKNEIKLSCCLPLSHMLSFFLFCCGFVFAALFCFVVFQ